MRELCDVKESCSFVSALSFDLRLHMHKKGSNLILFSRNGYDTLLVHMLHEVAVLMANKTYNVLGWVYIYTS